MPEVAGSAQHGQLPAKAIASSEQASGDIEPCSSETQPSATDPARTAALKARKRTKTGCLTCRKRRIKCGEERPTCKNCVKSKRDCEGYIPRVIFKDPLGAFRSGQHGIAVRTPQPPDHHGAPGIYGNMPSTPADTPIAPRLPWYTGQAGCGPVPTGSGHVGPGNCYSASGFAYPPVSNGTYTQQYSPRGAFPLAPFENAFNGENFAKAQVNHTPYQSLTRHTTGESDSGIDMGYADRPPGWSHGSESSTARSAEFPVTYAENPTMMLLGQNSPDFYRAQAPQDHYSERKPFVSPHTNPGIPTLIGTRIPDVVNYQADNQHHFYDLHHQTPWVEEPEDEYYDVDSEDEAYDVKLPFGGTSSYNLGPLIAMSANHSKGGLRSMTNFLNEPNVLASYHPSYAASPLMDSHTARVFCHFITATAPTLAVCERRPSDPTIIFSGVPVPKSQRALWSYTLPMLALTHQGLLHAMLALGSLHIAKLQQSSPTPSLKHYHYALRRVAKALSNSKKRKDAATLAATLLLGFYEITTAEHNKWNSHLSGARELIMDIDFAGTAKKIRQQRCRQEEQEAKSKYQMHDGHTHGYHQPYARRGSGDFPAKDRQLDENFISTIIGWKTKYDQYGQVLDDSDPAPASNGPLTPQDVENFEIQCDLFWWYAKQDMYQSIVSGNRLLFPYDRWGLCPPRAPIGRLDAVYGSLDHLVLLMGRMADFASKDLPRKLRRQREAEKKSRSQSQSGGNQMTQVSCPQEPSTMPNGMQTRPMYGMIPDPGPVRLPPGFDQAQHDAIYTAPVPSEDKCLETATYEAEAEWASIMHAFDVYFEALGPAYAPLGAEHMTPMATPFGPALYYRSYSIACVLNMYYCGRIICMRINPNMPPAAMAAAGVTARSTAHYANTIGRICAGIQPIDSTVSINPHHGAALMDCCMPLFQAGVQYQDPGQRGWTITKLRDVARLTGWQTSALIASGCERAWMRAAEMGRGPPYTRTMNENAKDDRVAGRGRDPKMMETPAKDNNDRRFITVNAGTRVYWALGVLGVEEDMKGMKLD